MSRFIFLRSNLFMKVLGRMLTHYSITYLLFVLDFLLDFVFTEKYIFWVESHNSGLGMDRKYSNIY